MKKFLAIIAITSVFAACGESATTEETPATDSSATIQSAPADSITTAPVDSLKTDSSAVKAVDSPATK